MAAMKTKHSRIFGLQTHTISLTNLHAEDRTPKPTISCTVIDYTYAGSLGGKLQDVSRGYVVVSTAERDGRRLIAVVLKNETRPRPIRTPPPF